MQICPECKGQGQKYLHLLYAKGKGRSGWQWKTCWRCNGTKEVSEEVISQIEAGKELNELLKSKGLRYDLGCLKGQGISETDLSSALMGRLPIEEIQSISQFLKEL